MVTLRDSEKGTKASLVVQAVEHMVTHLDKAHLRPMQKDSYLCMAKCCETSPDTNSLQNCCNQCERGVVVAQQIINSTIRDFQDRLQRCVQRCQDKAQEGLSTSPTERDVEKAQVKLAECAADCAQEYERQIPKLQKDIIEKFKRVKSS